MLDSVRFVSGMKLACWVGNEHGRIEVAFRTRGTDCDGLAGPIRLSGGRDGDEAHGNVDIRLLDNIYLGGQVTSLRCLVGGQLGNGGVDEECICQIIELVL